MRIRSPFSSALTPILLALIPLALSYLKFARCLELRWLSPGVYQSGCYTDITALYGTRGFSIDRWPYSSGADSLEYPLLLGMAIWLLALLTRDGMAGLNQFFFLNIIIISLFYFLLVNYLRKFNRQNPYIFLISPALILALFINWDIWAITPMVIALYFFQEGRFTLAAIALAISISLKFFPILLILPMVIHLWGRKRDFYNFFGSFTGTVLAINLPFAIIQLSGWSKFYIYNFERGIDFGSLWYLFTIHDIWLINLNWFVTVLLLVILICILYRYRSQYLGAIFLSFISFFILNKVYSPQYVLWIAVLAIIFFPKTKLFYLFYSIWQVTEIFYHFGIWRYILTLMEDSGGISLETYALLTAIRILSTVAMTGYAIYLLENNLIKSSSSKTER